MKTTSPLAYKVRMTVLLLVAAVCIVVLLAQLLVSAIGPVKTPFFNIALIGLLGMLLTDLVCILHVIIHGKGKLDLWIAIPGGILTVMGLGGFIANALLL